MTPYPFKQKPYKHQLDCWHMAKDRAAFALFMEQGTGKSKATIDQAAWLWDQGEIDSLVVLAPKGVYRVWADSELPAHIPAHIQYAVGVWTAEGRKADIDALDAMQRADGLIFKVLLMNIEALGRDLQNNRAYDYLRDFLTSHRAMLVIDESTTIKNPTATRTKAVLKARTLAPYRRILSGTPSPNGPLNLFSQCAFLDPALLGYGSYYSFRAHFAKLVQLRFGARKIQKVAGYRNLDELHNILSRFSFIVKKEDCLDLPPKIYQTRHVEMGKQQLKAYMHMKRLAIVEIEEILANQPQQAEREATWEELQRGTVEITPARVRLSTAQIVITQLMRLHQILCGFMVSDDRQVVPFDEPNPRMEALMEGLEQVAGKAIIWATYRFNVRQIAARIAEEYGLDSVVSYYGETLPEDRRTAIRRFQDPSDPCRFFVANKTGSKGITLTQASDVFYYSNDYDLETRQQNEDRCHRIGQTKSVTYTDLVVPGTQDEKVVEALRNKQSISDIITASNWRQFLGAD